VTGRAKRLSDSGELAGFVAEMDLKVVHVVNVSQQHFGARRNVAI